MMTLGYVRVSTDWRAEHGVSLEAQEAKIRAMAVVHVRELSEVIGDGGESAKSLNSVAKLDRLTRSVKDLCGWLELFEKRKVTLISVAESLDTGSAAGRLVLNIMTAVSQWEREAIGERTRDPCATNAPGVSALATSRIRLSRMPWSRSGICVNGR
jgi:site-specific DNA recombinase